MKKLIGLYLMGLLVAIPAMAGKKAPKRSLASTSAVELPTQVLALIGDSGFEKILNQVREKQIAANQKADIGDKLVPNPYIYAFEVKGGRYDDVVVHLAMTSDMWPSHVIAVGMVKAKVRFFPDGINGMQSQGLEFVPTKHAWVQSKKLFEN